MPKPVIGKLLGHETQRTTEHYSHVSDSPAQLAAEQHRQQDYTSAISDPAGKWIEFRRRP